MKDFRNVYRDARAYHQNAKGLRGWFLNDNYEAIAERCSKDGHILDLGCGECCLGTYLKSGVLVGIDLHQEALDLAQELHPGRYSQLIANDLCRLDETGLEPASFDTAVCSLTLMYLDGDGLRNCLKQVHGLLKPEGRFIVTYPTVGMLRQANPEAAELQPLELRARLEQAGFRIEEMFPLCPMMPMAVVEASQHKDTAEEAFQSYTAAKEEMTMDTSYHFVVVSVKNG